MEDAKREVLLFWRQASASVLLFATGPEMLQGEHLTAKIGGANQPLFEYEVAAVYTADCIALVAEYCEVWEPVLQPSHVDEMRQGIQRVRRAGATCKAYLLKAVRVLELPKPAEDPKPVRKSANFNPIMN